MKSSKVTSMPLKKLVIYSWLAPGLVSILISVLFFILLGAFNHQSETSRKVDELNDKSNVIARRLSAELILGEKGASQAISNLLTKELAVEKIIITDKTPCFLKSNEDTCLEKEADSLTYFRKIPFLDTSKYVGVTLPNRSFLASLQSTLLLWIIFPVFLFLGLGLYIQRRFLGKYIISPIESLVETTTGTSAPKQYWPLEIQNISDLLSKSYDDRDKVVFGKLASGVIHDVKTLIQSLVSATSLVEEVEPTSDSRARRLELLFKACKGNLHRIEDIIDHTLDGSREIPIRLQVADLSKTIENSIQTIRNLSTSRNVRVVNQLGDRSFIFPHDPVQMERAFTNLLKNGIEAFDDEKDSSPLRTLKIATRSLSSDPEIVIQVEDSGPGFNAPPGSVFKALKTTKAHGHGLGLFISKRIVEGHNGSIEAGTSDELKGASLTIKLHRDNNSQEVLL